MSRSDKPFDLPRAPWQGVVLALALLATGCASLPLSSGRGMDPRHPPREAATSLKLDGPSEAARVLHPPSESSPWQHRRRGSLETVKVAGPGRVRATEGSALPRDNAEPTRRSALAAHLALLGAVRDVSGTTHRIASGFSRLQSSEAGIGGRYAHVFGHFVDRGVRQLRWVEAELAAATRLATTASEVVDPDMQLAVLRLAGPRLEAAVLGSLLLSVWLDLLTLADAVLQHHPYYGVERLVRQVFRWERMIQPTLTVLASWEPGQVEAAAEDLPLLVGHLAEEFAATREAVRVSGERFERMVVAKELLDTLATASVLRAALPRLVAPDATATLGAGLVVGAQGVTMGMQVVVTAEWVELMRRLVQAGVLSVTTVSAAVRIHAGQVVMAQAHDELPKGVREALGDGPEVRGMRVTDRAGAGMTEPPQHHVLPREFRAWFEQRGFTGEMSIDRFCVRMEQSSHQAIHGGGNWRLGRQWPGEWNRMIMEVLREAETRTGRSLTRNEILRLVANYMKQYDLPMNFSPWTGR